MPVRAGRRRQGPEGKHPLRGGRVDRIADRSKTNAAFFKILDHLQQIANGAGKGIQPDDDKHVAGSQISEQSVNTGRAREAPVLCS